MSLGQRMDRDYARAVGELNQAYRSGEFTDEEWAIERAALFDAYERAVDTVAENIAEYGRGGQEE